MNKNQILNATPIEVELYGEKERLSLYATMYIDENFAILAYTDTHEPYVDITINVPNERMLGNVAENELVINHDISQRMLTGAMRPILDFLTDQPARTVAYGRAFSIAIVPKPEIQAKLDAIREEMLSRDSG